MLRTFPLAAWLVAGMVACVSSSDGPPGGDAGSGGSGGSAAGGSGGDPTVDCAPAPDLPWPRVTADRGQVSAVDTTGIDVDVPGGTHRFAWPGDLPAHGFAAGQEVSLAHRKVSGDLGVIEVIGPASALVRWHFDSSESPGNVTRSVPIPDLDAATLEVACRKPLPYGDDCLHVGGDALAFDLVARSGDQQVRLAAGEEGTIGPWRLNHVTSVEWPDAECDELHEAWGTYTIVGLRAVP